MNSVSLIGNLTRDPETRTTQSGMSVCNFSVAYSDKRRDKTYFFDVTTWDKNADICSKFLNKGSRVGIEGNLVQETWEAKVGTKKSRVSINANSVDFLTPKGGEVESSQAKESKPANEKQKDQSAQDDDDLPF